MSRLSDLAAAISPASPKVRAFAVESAAETDALAARIAKLEAPSPPSPVPTGRGTALARTGSSYNPAEDLSEVELLIVDLNALMAPKDWPQAKVLFYSSATCVESRYLSGAPWKACNDQGLLLKNAAGGLIVSRGYQTKNIGDIGNPVFQELLAQTIIAQLRAGGFVGVWLDDALRTYTGLTLVAPPKYPTQALWEAAVVSCVTYVGNKLREAGFLTFANATGYTAGDPGSNDGSLEKEFWTRLLPGVDGLTAEYWEQNPNDTTYVYRLGHGSWLEVADLWEGLYGLCAGQGKHFVPLCYGRTPSSPEILYTRGLFLLDYDGVHGYYCLGSGPVSPGQAWSKRMGAEIRPRTQSVYVLTRSFQNGTVTVNAAPGPPPGGTAVIG